MTVGIVMLVHTALHRAEQVCASLDRRGVSGCDPCGSETYRRKAYRAFEDALSDDPLIRFSKRHRCE